MKKILIISIILISYGISNAGTECFHCQEGYTDWTYVDPATNNTSHYKFEHYPTSAEASAALSAAPGSNYTTSIGSTCCAQGCASGSCNTAKWLRSGAKRVTVGPDSNGDYTYTITAYMYLVESWCNTHTCPDVRMACIIKEVKFAGDEEGQKRYVELQIYSKNTETGEVSRTMERWGDAGAEAAVMAGSANGSIWSVGSTAAVETGLSTLFDEQQQSAYQQDKCFNYDNYDDLMDALRGPDNMILGLLDRKIINPDAPIEPEEKEIEMENGREKTEVPWYQDADESTTTTEKEALDKIAENQKRDIQNKKETAKEQKVQTTIIRNIQQQQEVQKEENQIKENEANEKIQDDQDDIEAINQNMSGAIPTFDSSVGEMPDKKDMETELPSGNPIPQVNQLLSGSQVQLVNPSCSITWNYGGNDVDFTICAFEGQLRFLGNLMLGFVGLQALIYIFRRQ